MMLKRITVFSLEAVLTLSTMLAGSEPMTLHDCMEYAISKSTKIKIQKADIEDKRLEIRDAVLSAFTPVVTASSYAYYNFGRSIDPQTNTYFNQTSFHNNYSLSAYIDLFDGLSAVNNIKISKTALLISKSQEKQVEADICLAVMEAYYNVIYYSKLCDVYRNLVKDAEQALSFAKRGEELGVKGYADVIQMEADLADRQYDLISTVNMANDRLMTLKALLFWDEEEELVVDQTLPDFIEESFDPEMITLLALDNNSEVKMAAWNVENSKRELRVARWSLLPTVTLYGGWNTSYYNYSGAVSPSYGSQFRNNMGEYVELGLTMPLYNRLKGVSNIQKKKHAYNKARLELDQKRMDIEMEVSRAVQDCKGASVAYIQSLKKSCVQEEAFRLNRKKLEQGLISSLEFQTANNNYLKAKSDEMNSLFKYLIKKAVVKYYSGIEYIDQD
ncbi:MAG: TolC family protein [Muribaculaceae bacterium]|nr:TolC family protein [Muribaculaceae bacterium]